MKVALEDRGIEADKAKREMEQAKRSTTCQICMERRVELVLNGCGHVICAPCIVQVDRCPFCRREMQGTTKLRW